MLLLGSAAAQDAKLPRVPVLGAMPDAPRIRVSANGALDTSALTAGTDVVLWCDANAPCSAIATASEKAAANGARVVYFAATQPDGLRGALALALPTAVNPATTLIVRAHRERSGVPARSVVPLLTRIRKGWERDGARTFVLELDVPAKATSQELLSLLAAATESGVRSASVSICDEDGEPRSGELALDLAGVVWAQVLAANPPLATSRERPQRYGPMIAAQPPAPRERNGIGCGIPPPEPAEVIAWLMHAQRADGSAGEGTDADLEATSLAALALLGGGHTLESGTWCAALRQYIGWLLAHQRSDGSFEPPAAGSLQRHAQITYALAETAGLSASGDLLREAVGDAIRWLVGNRRREGGWGSSCGAPPNAIATAWSFVAITAASRYSLTRVDEPRDVLAWFDRFADDAPPTAGAEMLCRFLAGQDPRTTPRLAKLVDIVLDTDLSDPQATFWASYALYQQGGGPWSLWSKRLTKRVVETQIRDGKECGSWHPTNELSRTTTTAFHLLTMESYYRYGKLMLAH